MSKEDLNHLPPTSQPQQPEPSVENQKIKPGTILGETEPCVNCTRKHPIIQGKDSQPYIDTGWY